MPKLEDDLRIADREAIHVTNAPSKDESVVVKAEVGSVQEDDFSYLRTLVCCGIGDESHTNGLGRALHDLAEVPEVLKRREALGLQDEFGFKVGDLVQLGAINIGCRSRDIPFPVMTPFDLFVLVAQVCPPEKLQLDFSIHSRDMRLIVATGIAPRCSEDKKSRGRLALPDRVGLGDGESYHRTQIGRPST